MIIIIILIIILHNYLSSKILLWKVDQPHGHLFGLLENQHSTNLFYLIIELII